MIPKNLKISDKAVICMPYHKQQDCLEEDRLGSAKFGSTRRGISPAYGDKYMKKVLRMGDLLDQEYLEERLDAILPWKSLILTGVYGAKPLNREYMLFWLRDFGAPLKDFICDTGAYLEEAVAEGKRIMFEAQLGALRDIDFGIFPYTSSSSTISAYAPVGAGIPGHKLDLSVGVMKAYSTCVGEGPFVCEMFGEEAERLREAGGEYGAATGRPRRVGPFDVLASRYGVRMQGADEIALTKLDVLSDLEEIPVCVGYQVGGQTLKNFPTGAVLEKAKPIVERVPGWNQDISKCRSLGRPPKAAQEYIRLLKQYVGCPIRYVSVGAEREAYILVEGSKR